MKKKVFKYIGNILMILSIVFIFIKLRSFNIDYSLLLEPYAMIWVSILTLMFGIHIFLLPIAWKIMIKLFTGENIAFFNISLVFCKSNIMKYIPGNVFQYIGRNEIAVKNNLSHLDVGLSTLVDVINNIAGVFLVAIICYFPGLVKFLKNYDLHINPMYIVIFLLVLLLFAILLLIFRNKVQKVFEKYRRIFSLDGIKSCLLAIFIYVLSAVYTGVIYLLVVNKILSLELDISQNIMLMGAYLLSWIIGFVMPGAPGGIGIREAALMLMLEGISDMDSILLGIIVYRFINVIGDLVGLLIAKSFVNKGANI